MDLYPSIGGVRDSTTSGRAAEPGSEGSTCRLREAGRHCRRLKCRHSPPGGQCARSCRLPHLSAPSTYFPRSLSNPPSSSGNLQGTSRAKNGVHKGLHQEPVNTLSIISTTDRCHVGDQNTDQPWALNGKECGRESCAVLAGTQAAHISETRRQRRLIDQRDNGTRNQIPVRGRWDFVPASRFQANLPRWQTRQDRVVLGHTTW
jgi:hypothetical protein